MQLIEDQLLLLLWWWQLDNHQRQIESYERERERFTQRISTYQSIALKQQVHKKATLNITRQSISKEQQKKIHQNRNQKLNILFFCLFSIIVYSDGGGESNG